MVTLLICVKLINVVSKANCIGLPSVKFPPTGEYDALPEQAFYMVGPIEEVVQKAKKLAEEQL